MPDLPDLDRACFGVDGDVSTSISLRLYREYAEIRTRRTASSLGARRSGLNALSVPIFDRDGQVVVAVTALGVAPRFDADVTGKLAGQMLALSGELSAQMGFRAA